YITSPPRCAIAVVRAAETAERTVCANMFAPSYSVVTITPTSVLYLISPAALLGIYPSWCSLGNLSFSHQYWNPLQCSLLGCIKGYRQVADYQTGSHL